jgi:hypothetical protein
MWGIVFPSTVINICGVPEIPATDRDHGSWPHDRKLLTFPSLIPFHEYDLCYPLRCSHPPSSQRSTFVNPSTSSTLPTTSFITSPLHNFIQLVNLTASQPYNFYAFAQHPPHSMPHIFIPIVGCSQREVCWSVDNLFMGSRHLGNIQALSHPARLTILLSRSASTSASTINLL